MSKTKTKPEFTIAAVERDVGLSKDVLRVWERRYGFPVPERDANGGRLYPAGQVLRLRLIKRMMDQGHRPGRLLTASVSELEALAASCHDSRAAEAIAGSDGLDKLLVFIRQHQAAAYLQAMQQRLARQGLRQFVQDTVAPLTVQVGLAWEQGKLQVFEEHLFTELTARVLRQAIAAVPGGSEPRVLLTTLPKEPHGMGLLMLEAVLSLEARSAFRSARKCRCSRSSTPSLRTRSMSSRSRFRLPFPCGRFPRFWSNCARHCPAKPSCGLVARVYTSWPHWKGWFA